MADCPTSSARNNSNLYYPNKCKTYQNKSSFTRSSTQINIKFQLKRLLISSLPSNGLNKLYYKYWTISGLLKHVEIIPIYKKKGII